LHSELDTQHRLKVIALLAAILLSAALSLPVFLRRPSLLIYSRYIFQISTMSAFFRRHGL
jgi:hypothetical protein